MDSEGVAKILLGVQSTGWLQQNSEKPVNQKNKDTFFTQSNNCKYFKSKYWNIILMEDIFLSPLALNNVNKAIFHLCEAQ